MLDTSLAGCKTFKLYSPCYAKVFAMDQFNLRHAGEDGQFHHETDADAV